MLNCEDLEFSLKGVSVAAWRISMIRHEKWSCYNSDIQCPICHKLHMFDKTPDLNRLICPYSVIVIAPPTGNRKWHILRCNKLPQEILWHNSFFFSYSILKAWAMLNCEDLEFSLKGVSVAAWQISMIRHEKGSCYNSDIQCPICPKLHMFDKTPDLKRLTCPYSVIVIAPPTGNRKWHILRCNKLPR